MIVIRLFIILLCLPLPSFGWGFFAHQRINQLAVFLLPPEMMVFYKPHIDYLSTHASDADKRRYVVAGEAPRHFIDLDHYDILLPHTWQAALDCYGSDTLNTYGILPWHLQLMMTRLTNAFKDRDLARILRLSADLGHYLGDACVPLHASSNHDGQLSEQEGIHALWESRIPELMADQTFTYWTGKAEYINNINSCIWQTIRESAMAADTVLSVEKQLSREFAPNQRYAYEKRQGKLVRNYAAAYTKAYQQRLGDMVERRMRTAVHLVASCWYTAWVNAGEPRLQ
jgi:hypothetical protein